MTFALLFRITGIKINSYPAWKVDYLMQVRSHLGLPTITEIGFANKTNFLEYLGCGIAKQ